MEDTLKDTLRQLLADYSKAKNKAERLKIISKINALDKSKDSSLNKKTKQMHIETKEEIGLKHSEGKLMVDELDWTFIEEMAKIGRAHV